MDHFNEQSPLGNNKEQELSLTKDNAKTEAEVEENSVSKEDKESLECHPLQNPVVNINVFNLKFILVIHTDN